MAERLRVLVVDDEEGIRLGVARVLEKFVASFPDIAAEISYEVEAAADRRDRASSACARRRPTFCCSTSSCRASAAWTCCARRKRWSRRC